MGGQRAVSSPILGNKTYVRKRSNPTSHHPDGRIVRSGGIHISDSEDPAQERATAIETADDPDDLAATAQSSTYKVSGETPQTSATGVIGRTTATSSITYGVLGEGRSPSVQGVVGAASSSTPNLGIGGVPTGVWGFTDKSSADTGVTTAYGVYAQASASTGVAHGVYGISSASSGYSVFAAGDSKTTGVAEMGTQSVDKVGLDAYLTTDQTVQELTFPNVQFDTVDRDDFGGLDTSTGTYTVGADGDYHVSTAIRWKTDLSGGVEHNVYIDAGGTVEARLDQEVPGATSESAKIHDHLSKTVYDLSEGDTIEIQVYIDNLDGSDEVIKAGKKYTYLTIDKVG